jgi:hypothetical protein
VKPKRHHRCLFIRSIWAWLLIAGMIGSQPAAAGEAFGRGPATAHKAPAGTVRPDSEPPPLGLAFDRFKSDGRTIPQLPAAALMPDQMIPGRAYRGAIAREDAHLPGIRYFGRLSDSFIYGLHFGSAEFGTPPEQLFLSFERPDGNRSVIAVDQAWAGSFKWATPIDGLSLSGSLAAVNGTPGRSPLDAHLGGLPISYDPPPSGHFSSSLTSVAKAEHRSGKFRLNAEYVRSRLQLSEPSGSPAEQVGEGFAGRAGYRITDWLEFGSLYSIYYADRDDRRGDAWSARGRRAARAWIRDFALSTRFDFTDRMMLQLEGHFMNGLLGVPEEGDENWMLFTTQLQFQF